MSDEDPLVNGVPLSTLRVVDLKEELTRRGLAKHGNKSELAERLREVCNFSSKYLTNFKLFPSDKV